VDHLYQFALKSFYSLSEYHVHKFGDRQTDGRTTRKHNASTSHCGLAEASKLGLAERQSPLNDTYNGVFDNRQQTDYVRAVSQILQYLYLSLDFLLLHRLQMHHDYFFNEKFGNRNTFRYPTNLMQIYVT